MWKRLREQGEEGKYIGSWMLSREKLWNLDGYIRASLMTHMPPDEKNNPGPLSETQNSDLLGISTILKYPSFPPTFTFSGAYMCFIILSL